MELLDVFSGKAKNRDIDHAPTGALFAYEHDRLEALPTSLSLPFSSYPREARAIFANLMPEGLVREYLGVNVSRIYKY